MSWPTGSLCQNSLLRNLQPQGPLHPRAPQISLTYSVTTEQSAIFKTPSWETIKDQKDQDLIPIIHYPIQLPVTKLNTDYWRLITDSVDDYPIEYQLDQLLIQLSMTELNSESVMITDFNTNYQMKSWFCYQLPSSITDCQWTFKLPTNLDSNFLFDYWLLIWLLITKFNTG